MKNSNIISLVSKIRNKANKFITTELEKNNIVGLSPSHGDILIVLFKNSPVQMKELASLIDKDKSTITTLVDKLIKYDFVYKTKDDFDSRVSYIDLTEKGKELKPIFFNISESLILNIFKDITKTEEKNAMKVLNKINSNLD